MIDDRLARTFSSHPLTAYDPQYTRDYDVWIAVYDDWRHDIKRRAKLCRTRKEFLPIFRELVDTYEKIYAYERATGNTLLSFHDTRLNLVQNRNYLTLLDKILQL